MSLVDYKFFIPKVYHKLIDKRKSELETREFDKLIRDCFQYFDSWRWGWISPKGVFYPCGYAAHDWVVYNIFNTDVPSFEKEYGRFSELTYKKEENVFKFVTNPTNQQIRKYYDIMANFNE